MYRTDCCPAHPVLLNRLSKVNTSCGLGRQIFIYQWGAEVCGVQHIFMSDWRALMTLTEGHPGQLAYTFLIRILQTSFISVSIFSVCCYSRVSISMVVSSEYCRKNFLYPMTYPSLVRSNQTVKMLASHIQLGKVSQNFLTNYIFFLVDKSPSLSSPPPLSRLHELGLINIFSYFVNYFFIHRYMYIYMIIFPFLLRIQYIFHLFVQSAFLTNHKHVYMEVQNICAS